MTGYNLMSKLAQKYLIFKQKCLKSTMCIENGQIFVKPQIYYYLCKDVKVCIHSAILALLVYVWAGGYGR